MNDEMREANFYAIKEIFDKWHFDNVRYGGATGEGVIEPTWAEIRAFQAAYQLQQTKLDKAVNALERASTATTGGMRAYIEQTLLEIKEIKI